MANSKLDQRISLIKQRASSGQDVDKRIATIKQRALYGNVENQIKGKEGLLSQALSSVPVIQSAQAASEVLNREEALFAEPIVRLQTGNKDLLEGAKLAIEGKTISPIDPNRQTQLGDALRIAGVPEPLAAIGGFGASFLLPSSLAIAGISGKLAKGAVKAKRLADLKLVRQAGKRLSRFKLLDRISPMIDEAKFVDAFDEATKSGIFPDIKRTFTNIFDDLMKNKEVTKRLTPQAIESEARRRTLANVTGQLKKETGLDLLANSAETAAGELNVFGNMGQANPRANRTLQALDEISEQAIKAPGSEKDLGAFGQLMSRVNIQSDVTSKNPLAKGIFKTARFVEQNIIEPLSNRFGTRLSNIQRATGIKLGSNESRQVGLMLDSFDDLAKVPRNAGFKDTMVKNLMKNNGTSAEVTRSLVDDIFPTALPEDNIMVAFDNIRRRITVPIAEKAKLPVNRTIKSYLTKIYEDASKNSGKVSKTEMLNKIGSDLGVDPATHESILRDLNLIKENIPVAAKANIKEKFFGPLSKSRANNIPQSIKDQLILSRNFDAFDVMSKYIKGATSKIGIDEFLPRARTLHAQMGRTSEISKYSGDCIEAFRGVPQGNTSKALNKIAAFEAWRQFTSKIGLRPITAVVNLTQTPINTLTELVGQHGFKNGGKAFIRGLSEFFTSKGQKLIRASGSILDTPGVIKDINFHKKLLQKTADVAGFMFQKAETFNRGVSFLAGRRVAIQKGANIRTANQMGRELTDLTQFIFGKSNRPLFLQTPIGSMMGRFKIFTINQINFIKRNVKSPKAIATFIGMTAAIGGPDAIPIIEGFRQQMNETSPDNPLTKALNAAQRTSIAGQLGIDLGGGRLGIPLMQEMNMFTKPGGKDNFNRAINTILGPTYADSKRLFETVSNIMASGVSQQTVDNLIRLSSTEFNDIREAIQIASTGKLTDSRGRTRFEVPREDAVRFALGFETPEVVAERKKIDTLVAFNEDYRSTKRRVMDLFLDGKGEQAFKLANKGVKVQGKRVPIMVDGNSFVSAIMSRMLTTKQRILKSTPRIGRAVIKD